MSIANLKFSAGQNVPLIGCPQQQQNYCTAHTSPAIFQVFRTEGMTATKANFTLLFYEAARAMPEYMGLAHSTIICQMVILSINLMHSTCPK